MRHKAINNLYPNVSSQTNDLAFDVKGNSIVIDEAKVAKEVKRLEAVYDSKKYQRDRAVTPNHIGTLQRKMASKLTFQTSDCKRM